MILPDEWVVEVRFAVEDGYLAHQCRANDCARYFKVHKDDVDGRLSCPYCGRTAARNEFLTPAQKRHMDATIENAIMPDLEAHVDQMLRRALTGPEWTFSPGPKRSRRSTPPIPQARDADSRLTCPVCSVRFQVDGIFGLCPRCGTDNLRVYDADVALIRRQIAADPLPDRALRHAYGDGVSTFEIFCRREVHRAGGATNGLQNLVVARERFREILNVDILAPLGPEQYLALRRLFQKRHVWEHNGGVIDARYVKEIPEDSSLLGAKAQLSLNEFVDAMDAMRSAIDVVVSTRKE